METDAIGQKDNLGIMREQRTMRRAEDDRARDLGSGVCNSYNCDVATYMAGYIHPTRSRRLIDLGTLNLTFEFLLSYFYLDANSYPATRYYTKSY